MRGIARSKTSETTQLLQGTSESSSSITNIQFDAIGYSTHVSPPCLLDQNGAFVQMPKN